MGVYILDTIFLCLLALGGLLRVPLGLHFANKKSRIAEKALLVLFSPFTY
jgi:hypothetical protein